MYLYMIQINGKSLFYISLQQIRKLAITAIPKSGKLILSPAIGKATCHAQSVLKYGTLNM